MQSNDSQSHVNMAFPSVNLIIIYCPYLMCTEGILQIFQVVEIMADRVGIPIEVSVKRAGGKMAKLTVIPEECLPDL